MAIILRRRLHLRLQARGPAWRQRDPSVCCGRPVRNLIDIIESERVDHRVHRDIGQERKRDIAGRKRGRPCGLGAQKAREMAQKQLHRDDRRDCICVTDYAISARSGKLPLMVRRPSSARRRSGPARHRTDDPASEEVIVAGESIAADVCSEIL